MSHIAILPEGLCQRNSHTFKQLKLDIFTKHSLSAPDPMTCRMRGGMYANAGDSVAPGAAREVWIHRSHAGHDIEVGNKADNEQDEDEDDGLTAGRAERHCVAGGGWQRDFGGRRCWVTRPLGIENCGRVTMSEILSSTSNDGLDVCGQDYQKRAFPKRGGLRGDGMTSSEPGQVVWTWWGN
ncbi:hypothetical protein BCR39DRAFT_507678 [Naematelia encephala]|uniref:Uncharacterized protein n=1 Tax=Naematelia encephala TaxID=71784 RepID=A0A1Y2APR5_9TREE|nr:hypothetical protein BCR39DRAFT_507678 [Naematelia encephala]